MVRRLSSCGLVLPTHGNRIALIGPIPNDYDVPYTTLEQWAVAFSDSIHRGAHLRMEGQIAFAGLLASPSASAADLLTAIRAQTAIPCTMPEELAVLRFPVYITNVTIPIDDEYTHRVYIGPFETYEAAAAWRHASFAAGIACDIRSDSESLFDDPIQFLDDLPLRPAAHAALAQLLGLVEPSTHPYVCSVCYPTTRAALDEVEDGVALALLIDGSLSNGDFRLVGPFDDPQRCEKWCNVFQRLTRAQGGTTHALPVYTEPTATDFDWLDETDFSDAGRFPGLDAQRVAESARQLFDPSASSSFSSPARAVVPTGSDSSRRLPTLLSRPGSGCVNHISEQLTEQEGERQCDFNYS